MPIVVTSLCFSYQRGTPFEKKVLHDINLTIEDGEFLSIIGPTQSGKTTLAQHFNALHIPQKGTVLIDGSDPSDKNTDITSLRYKIGYVFQNPDYQLFAPTVGEDIAFGLKNQRLARIEIQHRVREAMAMVGLDYNTFYNRDIFALSGGQRRRTAIAGVLACRPKVLVLDDITAGLDPRGRDEILSVVRSLHSEQNVTIVFISSSMDFAAKLSDRIVVMVQGRIIMDNTVRKVLGRSGELRSIGLELPEATAIVHLLRAKGYPLPSDILSLDEALEAIDTALQKAGATKLWN
ncbi:MAG TPA: energy-coupling factor transporter ATPase [Candidatus Limnocylindrales bacterium]|nr:energy-coupling factor transporter ATPase [Candidatus Limnocylindrales bacterium]